MTSAKFGHNVNILTDWRRSCIEKEGGNIKEAQPNIDHLRIHAEPRNLDAIYQMLKYLFMTWNRQKL